MLLSIEENGAVVGLDGGSIYVKYLDEHVDKFPGHTVDGISLFGQSQLTTQMTKFCLDNGVRVSYFSKNGKFYGQLDSLSKVNVFRLKKQIQLASNRDFCLDFSKLLIHAKIGNQLVIARRYSEQLSEKDKEIFFRPLLILYKKSLKAHDLDQLRGYEGSASRVYFDLLSTVVDPAFAFLGRNRRPAKDPFNAMLNLGYSLLQKEVMGELENRGLNSYVGFCHQDKIGHATLASDLMEEWRAVIVDSVVLSIIQGHEIKSDDFYYEDNICKMNKNAFYILLSKLAEKMDSETKYLDYVEKPITFRKALWHQADCLAKVIDHEDLSLYHPIRIR